MSAMQRQHGHRAPPPACCLQPWAFTNERDECQPPECVSDHCCSAALSLTWRSSLLATGNGTVLLRTSPSLAAVTAAFEDPDTRFASCTRQVGKALK